MERPIAAPQQVRDGASPQKGALDVRQEAGPQRGARCEQAERPVRELAGGTARTLAQEDSAAKVTAKSKEHAQRRPQRRPRQRRRWSTPRCYDSGSRAALVPVTPVDVVYVRWHLVSRPGCERDWLRRGVPRWLPALSSASFARGAISESLPDFRALVGKPGEAPGSGLSS